MTLMQLRHILKGVWFEHEEWSCLPAFFSDICGIHVYLYVGLDLACMCISSCHRGLARFQWFLSHAVFMYVLIG